jgi:hypothetical protein
MPAVDRAHVAAYPPMQPTTASAARVRPSQWRQRTVGSHKSLAAD